MFSETIELRGHIIDSLILPKVLDEILKRGSTFKIDEVHIGQKRVDQSYARVEISAPSGEALDELILRIRQHGAELIERKDVQLASAPGDGIFPDDFYVTTNQQTFVRLDGHEIAVSAPMLDSGIAVDRAARTARSVRFHDIRKGDEIVVGHDGIRVVPVQRTTDRADIFQFFDPNISAERPKLAVIHDLAREFERERNADGQILVVAGPAVVQTGAAEHLERLIARGYVQRLFAGNGLAVYDMESAIFGTSLGIKIDHTALVDSGHGNHLRAVNAIRAAGGIAAAVKKQILTRGIMHACVAHKVDIVLSGSIRDDGPIPGVTSDAVEAQKIMREKLRGVTLVLMLGTMLHAIATANMLSAEVKIVVVDIDPLAVARITAQQPQSVGLVTDVEPFLRELVACLGPSR